MTEDNYVNSIIGQGSFFSGDLEISGLVRIDGDYAGLVRKASRVLVGSTGRADAIIHAAVVVIGGAFTGTIHASERVVLLSGALVLGTIYSPRLLVEPGALLGCSLGIHDDSRKEEDLDRTSQSLPRNRKTYQHALTNTDVIKR